MTDVPEGVIILSLTLSHSVPMPDETNDQLANEYPVTENISQQEDGSEAVEQTTDQGMDGQGSVQNTEASEASVATNSSPSEGEATAIEEEPVGSKRPEPRVIRKLNAADFKIKPEPKPEPRPEPEPRSAPQDVQGQTEQKVEPTPEPIPAPEPTPAPEPVQEPKPEPKPEPRPEPVQRQPIEATPLHTEPTPVSTPVMASTPEPVQEPKKEEPVAQPAYEQPQQQEQPQKKSSGASGDIMGSIKGALSFFTIFKLNVGEKEIGAFNKNFFTAPFAGLVIGIIASVIALIFWRAGAAAMVPIIAVASAYIMSKFLHFDGLVDFGDGMIVSGDKEDRIRALKDTRIGAGGFGIALIVVLAILAAYASILITVLVAMAIIIAEVFAKNAMVSAATFGQPGTGMAADQVSNTTTNTMLMSTILSVGLAFVGYLIMGFLTGVVVSGSGTLNPLYIYSALIFIAGAAVVSILMGWLMAYISNKHFGFVNGDVLGATNETSKVVILIIGILVAAHYTIPRLMEIGAIF